MTALNGELFAGKQYHDIPRARQQFAGKLCRELLVLHTINHRNIVRTFGVIFDADHTPIILMERMKTTLQEYILDKKVAATLSLVCKANFLCDVAKGLYYLHHHTQVIIHRDLTATNVLLDHTLRVAKLSDFGNAELVKLAPSNSTPISSQTGTRPYMPPEVSEGDTGSHSSFDVFSFGHLMLFTISGEIPALLGPTFADENGTIQGRSEADRRERHIIKCHQLLNKDHILNHLMKRCLHNTPRKRPSTNDLVTTLEYVVSGNSVL